MAIEIELKAWGEAYEATKAAISAVASYAKAFEKEDAYWYPVQPNAAVPRFGVRVRKETDGTAQAQQTWVTYKTKEVRAGIEVNTEREFAVSDAAVFEELLQALGLAVGAHKHKKGWAWQYADAEPPITIELTEVEHLGTFVELEILADNDAPETIAAARTRLLSLLHKIGIDECRIEARYYTEMLKKGSAASKLNP